MRSQQLFVMFELSLITVLLLVNKIETFGLGRCPTYPSMPKFNITKIIGRWYEVERSFYLPEIASGCTTLTFNTSEANTKFFEEDRLEVVIKTINRLTGNPSISIGYATPENNRSSIMNFEFNSRLPEVISRLLPGSGKYQILYTDYENFAIFWSCSSLARIGYSDQIWVFGREIDFPTEIRTKIYDTLKKLSLDSDRLTISKNKNCPSNL